MRRGRNETRLYVNGYLVARASSGTAQFDDTKSDLQLGRIPGAAPFQGQMADVRLYNRPLEEAEIQALVQPGKQFVQKNGEKKQTITLSLGGRQFSGGLLLFRRRRQREHRRTRSGTCGVDAARACRRRGEAFPRV